MKKLLLLAVLVSTAAIANAQQLPVLKQKYLPKHTYSINNKNSILMQVTMHSDSLAKATGGSGEESFEMKNMTEDNTDLKTAAASADKSFAVAMSKAFVSARAMVNGQEAPAPPDLLAGKTINGTINPDGKVNADTATTAGELNSWVKSMVNGLPTAINFPDKPLKVGDTFTTMAPGYELDLSNQGIKQDFTMNVTYKLTDIKDNLATFETSGEFDINHNAEHQGRVIKITGKGGGPGKLVFDIAKSYPLYIASQIQTAFEVVSDKARANFKATVWHETKVEVGAN
jgi:hypothetical protein